MATTVHCPKTHDQLAETCAGNEYGHVPGHQYHDVEVLISRHGDVYRCHVVETWGSAQGYDEEHGRREVIGRGESITRATNQAREDATKAGMDAGYLAQAMSQAIDEAEE